MDRKILNYLVAAIACVFLVSCEKDANIPVPKDVPKLVVYGYMTPTDSVTVISVTSSNPVFGDAGDDSFSPVTDATVTITTLGVTYTLTYEPTFEIYYILNSALGVNPGQAYTLNVSAPNFTAVTATTSVPVVNNFNPQITEVSTTAPSTSLGNPRIYKYTVNINYFANNYYRLSESFYHVDTSSGGNDTLVGRNHDSFYDQSTASGSTISDQLEAFTDIDTEPYAFHYGFYFDLIVSGYDYFKFHQSFQNYSQGNPFAEPSLIYSNMTNGYGIFAGYLKVTVRKDY
jgi:hypothetical protein